VEAAQRPAPNVKGTGGHEQDGGRGRRVFPAAVRSKSRHRARGGGVNARAVFSPGTRRCGTDPR
jgi:hypothetical protein